MESTAAELITHSEQYAPGIFQDHRNGLAQAGGRPLNCRTPLPMTITQRFAQAAIQLTQNQLATSNFTEMSSTFG
ncbi:hypothetical protein [Saccharopolyspora kobensis]|uniref:hypothetical protein n=1 Tax=Saccharopolyspora kobensis TaxID=146035 RepID=UPI0011B0D690|nr:hypothetical protein [Saccharopolyspora kobensis]